MVCDKSTNNSAEEDGDHKIHDDNRFFSHWKMNLSEISATKVSTLKAFNLQILQLSYICDSQLSF